MEIPQVQAPVEKVLGASRSKMRFEEVCIMKGEVRICNLLSILLKLKARIHFERFFSTQAFCRWPIQDLIPTTLSCKLQRTKIFFNQYLGNSFAEILSFITSFITFRSCKHLDGKHTVFGRVVGGLETLSEFEKVETDNKDRPIEDIKFVSCQVFTDPYEELDQQIAAEKAKEIEETAEKKKPKVKVEPLKVYREGAGKYINFKDIKRK